MNEYWIDFSGYVKVKAKNADEAARKFLKIKSPFPTEYGFSNDVWNIDAIEEVSDDIYNGWHKEDVIDFLLDREDRLIFDNPNAPSLQDIEDFWNDK